jgi:hypothetical protein
MASSGGDSGSWIKYASINKWEIATGNAARVTVQNNVTTIANDLSVTPGKIRADALSASAGGAVALTGNMLVTDDVNAAGGFRSAFVFSAPAVKQGEMTTMSSSIISGSEWATRYPMPSAGSVLRVALYSDDSNVTAGTGLTASVTVDGVQAAVNVVITTGSAAVGTAVAKDTATFSASQQLGVVLTASSGYLSSLAESGSFLASVLVEM